MADMVDKLTDEGVFLELTDDHNFENPCFSIYENPPVIEEPPDDTDSSPTKDADDPPSSPEQSSIYMLQSLCESDVICNRQLAAKNILKALQDVYPNKDDVHTVVSIICKMSDDGEGSVRAELVKHIPQVALFCQCFDLDFIIRQQLVPITVKLADDFYSDVRSSSQKTLLQLFEYGLVNSALSTEWVCPFVAMLASSGSTEQRRVEGIWLMCQLASCVSWDVTKTCFLDTFLSLCDNDAFAIRRECADNCTKMFKAASESSTSKELLLDKFLKLCSDVNWTVRKTCAEAFTEVVLLLRSSEKWDSLLSVFLRFTKDECRAVELAACQKMGEYIYFFANSSTSSTNFEVCCSCDALSSDDDESASDEEQHVSCLSDGEYTASSSDDSVSKDDLIKSFQECGDTDRSSKTKLVLDFVDIRGNFRKASYLQSTVASFDENEVVSSNANEAVVNENEAIVNLANEKEAMVNLANENEAIVNLANENEVVINFSNETETAVNENEITVSWSNESNVAIILPNESETTSCLSNEGKDTVSSSHETTTSSSTKEIVDTDSSNEEVKETIPKVPIIVQLLENLDSHCSNVSRQVKFKHKKLNTDKMKVNVDKMKKIKMEDSRPYECNATEFGGADNSQFNSFQYWRFPLPDIQNELNILELDIKSCMDNMSSLQQSQTPVLCATTTVHSSSPHNSHVVNEVTNDEEVMSSEESTNSEACLHNESMERETLYLTNLCRHQNIVPAELLERYLSMATRDKPFSYSSDIMQSCAHSFPAVVQTLGPENWYCLRQTFRILFMSSRWTVLKTMATCVHEVAHILGKDITSRDLLHLYMPYLVDFDDIRIVLRPHLFYFLSHVKSSAKEMIFKKLDEFSQLQNEHNWRFRHDLLVDLTSYVERNKSSQIVDYINKIAYRGLVDKVCVVRLQTVKLWAVIFHSWYVKISRCRKSQHQHMKKLVKIVLSRRMCKTLDEIKTNLMLSPKWHFRQLFVIFCMELGIVDQDSKYIDWWVEQAGNNLLNMRFDAVPNVLISVAKCLFEQLPDVVLEALQRRHSDSFRNTIYILSNHADRDVRSIAQRALGPNEE